MIPLKAVFAPLALGGRACVILTSMGPLGNIVVGALWIMGGVVLIVAESVTKDFPPVAILGYSMTVIGVALAAVGIIGAGVRVGRQ